MQEQRRREKDAEQIAPEGGEIEQAPASVGFDLVILRPFGLLATGLGVALAVPATAITALTHPQDVGKPIEFLVMRPARYTFADPIGTH